MAIVRAFTTLYSGVLRHFLQKRKRDRQTKRTGKIDTRQNPLTFRQAELTPQQQIHRQLEHIYFENEFKANMTLMQLTFQFLFLAYYWGVWYIWYGKLYFSYKPLTLAINRIAKLKGNVTITSIWYRWKVQIWYRVHRGSLSTANMQSSKSSGHTKQPNKLQRCN